MIGPQSPVVELSVRAATPLALAVGLYLLFAGHNNPGGGFAAGLVFGAVIILRTAAGMKRMAHSLTLISIGMIIVCSVAIAPLAVGAPLLDQGVFQVDVPLLGTVKTGGALPFDIGVTLIVVGLVIAFVDGLSSTSLALDGDADGETGRRT
ncbi:MAG: MnhB domain-containing protein [Acidimicrobiales bacterium]